MPQPLPPLKCLHRSSIQAPTPQERTCMARNDTDITDTVVPSMVCGRVNR